MRTIKIIRLYPLTKTTSEAVYLDCQDGKLKTMIVSSETSLGETVLDVSSLSYPTKAGEYESS